MAELILDNVPDGRLLSNGRYFVWISAAGAGQSRKHGIVVNRWTGDPVDDACGQFISLKDHERGKVWSIGSQPVPSQPDHYEMSGLSSECRIDHQQHEILAALQIVVAGECDLEIRQLSLKNESTSPRRIEVTGAFEAVLNWQGADLGHPAFSKLFLQTKAFPEENLLTVERRPRSSEETWPTLFFGLAEARLTEWETDRLRFQGRGCSFSRPAGLKGLLSGTAGNVLDPCCVLRTTVEIAPGEERSFSFLTGFSDNPDQARLLVREFQNRDAILQQVSRAAELERSILGELGITESKALQLHSLAAALIANEPRLRPEGNFISRETNLDAIFSRYSIPRDRPLIVVRNEAGTFALEQAIQARKYWNRKGLFTNLVIFTPESLPVPVISDRDDRIFLLNSRPSDHSTQRLIEAASSLVIQDELPVVRCSSSPRRIQTLHGKESPPVAQTEQIEDLSFSNGIGGFRPDGREYVIPLRSGAEGRIWPPLPWVNVIANEQAGFLISESGASCTWARNSQANRLTPWSNDPVADPHGEAVYLLDHVSGKLSSPFPGPVQNQVEYEIRHGLGYSKFQSIEDGLAREVTVFVPRESPLKITLIRLVNQTSETKSITLTSYQHLVMGVIPAHPSSITTWKNADGTLRAKNLAAGDFFGGIAFSSMTISGATAHSVSTTCDRRSFLGRHGTVAHPAALRESLPLDGVTGLCLEPCFAEQRSFSIPPGESVGCVLLLGEALSVEEADRLVEKYRFVLDAEWALDEVSEFWENFIGGLQIETPSAALNFMVNSWLPYQTLSCRIWGRSAFYQSSGAYGFRDQLQDAGNLLLLDSDLTREQILLHARHQFEEGDVLHWWHPEPIEKGVRTRFVDDLLWLPLITAEYVNGTGDRSLLDVSLSFLKGPQLQPGEDELFLHPEISEQTGSLYEHCCRAIDRSLKVGHHGLPLMGTGDWNDGMNRVGREGRGESVWMGFFLVRILDLFIPYCRTRGDIHRAHQYENHRCDLTQALNTAGWDGEWFRRAYFDNGHPLGSQLNEECRIDALAQAWGVISKGAIPEHAELAMKSMKEQLVSEEEGLIRLLTPPFVNMQDDPGYIKGYVAGVRENGGQYSHAACWVVMALAQCGENQLAARLLEMLTPLAHARTPQEVGRYKLEPYAVPGDIYGAAPHVGRGGWSWYTGAAGWMYRVAVESILGVQIENGEAIVLTPCIPDDWPVVRVSMRTPVRIGETSQRCEILIENPDGHARQIASALSNGQPVVVAGQSVRIPLSTEREVQQIHLVMK